jgi:hypothetical protein
MVEGRISQGVVVGNGSDIGGGASTMGTLSGGGSERAHRRTLPARGGVRAGHRLGDDCVVEAGLYVTAGTKVTLPDGTVAKARDLSGQSNLLFLRDSVTGAVLARPRDGHGIVLNSPCTATTDISSMTRTGGGALTLGGRSWSRRTSDRPARGAPARRCPRGRWLGGVRRAIDSFTPAQCEVRASGQSFTWAPDQASNTAVITAIAIRRGLPPRAATIAIATAIQESKVRNITYGDRDSVGLFQQRPSQGGARSSRS